ncbi:ATP-binding protein [Oceanobacillus halophilus]|uniref:histidine kinase n=1 Tax=Oceanobacillus halophilus TaxID=930130 RepID=A0A495A7N7_9BACI|nr:sensor histidine kinase [Oceanobacillus halophilus]RKQ35800.1 sensor histidine kinase [Oceanobacillus halophilus]
MNKRVKLRTKMLILSSILVFSSVIVSGITMLASVSKSFEGEIGERATAIARTISQLDDIRNAVGEKSGEEIIQPIAERIRLSTNVDYIVIMDMEAIRYSHPSESKIGEKFTGGDERAAFSELEYTSKAEGELGFAIRAFVPIMNVEGVEQVGVAVVGILSPTFQSLLKEYQYDLSLSLIWGLLIGLIGAWFLANNVKKQTYHLEPYEIARLFEERSTIMENLDTGIIATDNKGQISFMNKLAETYTGINFSSGMVLKELFTQSWITDKLDAREKLINKPVNINGNMYLVSIYPIFVKGSFTGSLINLQKRSEVHRLGEELTGVKSLVAALRAQNHEYMNKLHSIAGLIQLERTDEALDVIVDETSIEEDLVQFLRNRIKHYSISGLLLGKRSRARELGVQLFIDRESYVQEVVEGLSAGDIITILGNLLDNAIEACKDAETKNVSCLIQGKEDHLFISVKDSGKGIAENEKSFIFKQGYSTKAKEGRGIGLFIVKEIVEAKQGDLWVNSNEHGGTLFEIEISL